MVAQPKATAAAPSVPQLLEEEEEETAMMKDDYVQREVKAKESYKPNTNYVYEEGDVEMKVNVAAKGKEGRVPLAKIEAQ